MGWFGNSSLAIFIGLFGGSTLLLFLVCFCCQRKLQARTLAMADITNLEAGRMTTNHQGAPRQQRRSDTHQLIPSMIAPPPDYATVLKKEPAPPTYEAAVLATDAINGVPTEGHL